MFLTEHITRGVVHTNNALKLLGFKDRDIKQFKIDESEIEIHIHIKLRVKPYECKHCGTINKTLHSIRENIILHKHFTKKVTRAITKFFFYLYSLDESLIGFTLNVYITIF